MSGNTVPLRGDGNGVFRVMIIGNTGSGKSTLAKWISATLKVKYIDMDGTFWSAGWQASSKDKFSAEISRLLNLYDSEGWVTDGNYFSALGGLDNILTEHATDIIWLDPPLFQYFPRLVWRTFSRLFGFAPPCSPGCPESLKSIFFSKDSIVWWCITHHGRYKQHGREMTQIYGSTLNGGKVFRVNGWGAKLESWKARVSISIHT